MGLPVLRVGAVAPSVHPNGTNFIGGINMDFLGLMAKHMGFVIDLIASIDDKWGSRTENGSFNGMIGMVNRSEVEFGIGPFSFKPDRYQAVVYTQPHHFDYEVLVTPRPKVQSDIAGFVKAFPVSLWLLILASLVILPTALIFTEVLEGKIFNFKTTDLPGKSYMWAVKAITQEGSDWLPEMDAGRTVVGTWLMAGLVIVSAYSGILIAMLTLPKVVIKVDSVGDLVRQDELPWVINKYTAFTRSLQRSDDPERKLAYDKASGFIRGCVEALDMIVEGGYASFCPMAKARSMLALEFQRTGECRFYVTREVLSFDILGMTFRRDSPWIDKANRFFHGLMESGVYQKLIVKHFPAPSQCLLSPTKDKPGGILPLDIKSLGGTFILLTGGLILSTFVFLIEIAIKGNREPDESDENY